MELQANRAAAGVVSSSAECQLQALDNPALPVSPFPYDFIHMVIFCEDQMYPTTVSIRNESNPLLCLEYSI